MSFKSDFLTEHTKDLTNALVASYTKHDVYSFLEELFEASRVFVLQKRPEVFYNIVVQLMNERLFKTYKVEFYKLTVPATHRFYDLCILATIWRDIAEFTNKNADDRVKAMPEKAKSDRMQDMVAVTEKLDQHEYSTVNTVL